MQKSIEPVDIPLCVSATKYLGNDNMFVYSTIENNASRELRKLTFGKSVNETMFVGSENTFYIADDDKSCVYAISIIEQCLHITDFENYKRSFLLETCHEEIVEVYYKYGILFFKTVEEKSDGEQIKHLYMVDLVTDKILQVRNKIVLESYHMPYILNSNGNIRIVVEGAKIFPYELSEIRTGVEKDFGVNNVLVVSIDEFVMAEEKQESIPFDKAFDKELTSDYMQVLTTLDSIIILAFVDNEKKSTRVRWVNIESGYVEKDVVLPCRITDILYEKDVIIAYISWTEKVIAIYEPEGDLVSEVFTDELCGGNENLEINSIITIVDKKIVFDAKDYSGENEAQVRVLYDIFEKKYILYRSPFVIYRKQNIL